MTEHEYKLISNWLVEERQHINQSFDKLNDEIGKVFAGLEPADDKYAGTNLEDDIYSQEEIEKVLETQAVEDSYAEI